MSDLYSLDLERGSSSYLYKNNCSNSVKLSRSGTVEAWVALESLPSVAGSSFGIVTVTRGSDNAYTLYIDSVDNKPTVVFNDSVGQTKYKANTAFVGGDLGVFIHIAAIIDADGASVDFTKDGIDDGSNMVTNAATQISNGGTQSLYIGRTVTASQLFDGLIDEVRVWNTLRTIAQINATKDVFLTGSESGLKAYWIFNQSYDDQTNGNNDLSVNGVPVFSTTIPFEELLTLTLDPAVLTLKAELGSILLSGTATVSPAAASMALQASLGSVLITPGALTTKKVFTQPKTHRIQQ